MTGQLTANQIAVRFWAKVGVGDSESCWLWTAGRTGANYGGFHPRHGETVSAHVFAYLLTHGEVPDGMWVDHTCHNGTICPGGTSCAHRLCCNPAHLEAVVPAENSRRSHRSRGAQPVCPNGHEYQPETTRFLPDKGVAGWRVCLLCERARRPQKTPRRSDDCRSCGEHRTIVAKGNCSRCYMREYRASKVVSQ